jgi:hypothetical protein
LDSTPENNTSGKSTSDKSTSVKSTSEIINTSVINTTGNNKSVITTSVINTSVNSTSVNAGKGTSNATVCSSKDCSVKPAFYSASALTYMDTFGLSECRAATCGRQTQVSSHTQCNNTQCDKLGKYTVKILIVFVHLFYCVYIINLFIKHICVLFTYFHKNTYIKQLNLHYIFYIY